MWAILVRVRVRVRVGVRVRVRAVRVRVRAVRVRVRDGVFRARARVQVRIRSSWSNRVRRASAPCLGALPASGPCLACAPKVMVGTAAVPWWEPPGRPRRPCRRKALAQAGDTRCCDWGLRGGATLRCSGWHSSGARRSHPEPTPEAVGGTGHRNVARRVRRARRHVATGHQAPQRAGQDGQRAGHRIENTRRCMPGPIGMPPMLGMPWMPCIMAPMPCSACRTARPIGRRACAGKGTLTGHRPPASGAPTK